MKRAAIFGGTFNPVHTGHLIGAQVVCERLKLDQVIFMPCATPPHKAEGDLASGADRLKMVKLAVSGNKKFTCSDFEVRQARKFYSIETARFFRRKFSRETKIFFIIGQDNYTSLHTWKEIDELERLVTFVVLNRKIEGVERGQLSGRPRKFKNVLFVSMPWIDISSSLVRGNLNQKKSVRYLVPEGVLTYIQKKHLYTQTRGGKHG